MVQRILCLVTQVIIMNTVIINDCPFSRPVPGLQLSGAFLLLHTLFWHLAARSHSREIFFSERLLHALLYLSLLYSLRCPFVEFRVLMLRYSGQFDLTEWQSFLIYWCVLDFVTDYALWLIFLWKNQFTLDTAVISSYLLLSCSWS